MDVLRSDGKQYTFILKDELLPKSPNGREQSTVSWEYDFKLEGDDGKGKVFIKWDDLKPTYRGREKKDARPLDLKDIKSFSLMMRRYVVVFLRGCFTCAETFSRSSPPNSAEKGARRGGSARMLGRKKILHSKQSRWQGLN